MHPFPTEARMPLGGRAARSIPGVLFMLLVFAVSAHARSGRAPDSGGATPALSEASETCLECHASITPGITLDWERSRHAQTTIAEALQQDPLARRISAREAPEDLGDVCVGCAECHLLGPDKHRDTFDHNGYTVHTVVTPEDCATCHPAEANQFAANLMSAAHGNLMDNPLYRKLETSVNGLQHAVGPEMIQEEADTLTRAESCLHCHGTRLEVKGHAVRETALGDMEFPVLIGWPNQGTGRINPDGSLGACSACHTRHQFTVAMARQPATCGQCHKGPDVPAYPVYQVSKHGNLYEAMRADWDFEAVPWSVGRDFSAPTCAVCHVSLLTNGGGEVIAQRTHRMNDRLDWRLFGLPYAHPHPKSANTTMIRNRAGMPLPTELSGEAAFDYLIDASEMNARRARLQGVCRACHATGWTESQFDRLEHTIATTNEATLTATQLLGQAWDEGFAAGPARGGSPFDEAIEKMWTAQWLFYANSTRFASAMGGADYGVFANGRWSLARNLREMQEWLELRREGGTGR